MSRVLMVSAIVFTAAVGFAQASSDTQSAPTCANLQVSGGDYNGGGGTMYAAVVVRNLRRSACVVTGRPWIRLPRLPSAITVTDITSGPNAGPPSGSVRLRPGAKARATILIIPGSCDRSRSVTFTLRALAGWRDRSVRIGGLVCTNGTGQVAVGTFS